jgi:hypothetical protein
MAVTRFEIHRREAYADGEAFGDVGAYERIEGTLHFAVDPSNEANREVVDLHLAPRGDDGLVHFTADATILQPVDGDRANGNVLLDVVNRGLRTFVRYNRATSTAADPETLPAGDGYLMRNGWTMASVGWQWDVIPGRGLVGLEAPTAIEGGRPVEGQVMVTHQLTAPATHLLLADRLHRAYSAATLDQPEARLTVRDYPDAPRREVPRDRWRFGRVEDGRPVDDPDYIALEGGFEAGPVYEVVYRTNVAPVVGSGLLSFRDAASFLRHSTDATNPAAGRITHTFALGISQSGRFLRTLLHHGLNADEEGRPAFDGLHIHVAGGRRGEFNHRFAQPSMQYAYSFGHQPPFASDDDIDPLTEAPLPGLLTRVRALGVAPKVIATNSAAEYWRGDGALSHIDAAGERDFPDPPEVRSYLFAGTQHGAGQPRLDDTSALDATNRGSHYLNVVDYSPLFRAALANLAAWVRDGVEPPPSRVPRVEDGTAVTRAEIATAFHAFPGVSTPDAERLWHIHRLNLGARATEGVGEYPAEMGEAFPTLVSSVDADGNEVAGVRLPDISQPLATHTGWNPRHPDTGGAGQIMPMMGSTIPFAATRAEREAADEPRASIEERYRDREDYLARVRADAERLAADRYLVPDDVEVVVAEAARRWDIIVPVAAG